MLREGYADEGAWRLDPARPAVVVGTVDMVCQFGPGTPSFEPAPELRELRALSRYRRTLVGQRRRGAYGLALFRGRFTSTPNAGLDLADGRARDWRLGWRLTSALESDPNLEINLDATRREATNYDGPPEHGVVLRSSIRW